MWQIKQKKNKNNSTFSVYFLSFDQIVSELLFNSSEKPNLNKNIGLNEWMRFENFTYDNSNQQQEKKNKIKKNSVNKSFYLYFGCEYKPMLFHLLN